MPDQRTAGAATQGALVSHRYILIFHLTAGPCSPAGLLTPVSVSLWIDIGDPVFDGEGLEGFKSRANEYLLA